MYGKMQASGLTEFISFICTSAIWGQILLLVHLKEWLMAASFISPSPQQSPWGGWRPLLDHGHCVPFWGALIHLWMPEATVTFLAHRYDRKYFHFTHVIQMQPPRPSGADYPFYKRSHTSVHRNTHACKNTAKKV